MRLPALPALLALCACLSAVELTVGPNVQVSTYAPATMKNECFTAVDPSNPQRMLSASYTCSGTSSSKYAKLLIYRSGDGGASWQTLDFLTQRAGVMADPCVYFDSDGFALFSGLRYGDRLTHWSADGGSTWQQSVMPGEPWDHLRLALDPSSDRVYALAVDNTPPNHDLRLAISTDQGKTFGAWRAIPGVGNANTWTMNHNRPQVLSDGTLVVPMWLWSTATPLTVSSTYDFVMLRSGDGGATFSPPVLVAKIPCPSDGTERRSFQEGWYRPALNNRCGYNCFPVLAVDRSTAHRDRLYAAWFEPEGVDSFEHRLRTRIWVSWSDDKGASWSAKRRVEANPPAASRQGRPDLAVAADGAVAIAWIDTRGYEEADPSGNSKSDVYRYRIFASASADGGATWSAATAVSDQVSEPRFWSVWGYQLTWDVSWGAMGDETGLIAGAGPGRFLALWPDQRNGLPEPYCASLSLATTSPEIPARPDVPAVDQRHAARPTLSGSTSPLANVSLRDRGVVIASGIADALGAWSLRPAMALSPGPHLLSVVASNAAGSSPASGVLVQFVDGPEGRVQAWGTNYFGEVVVPAGSRGIAIASGGYHHLLLRSDHSVSAWGWNDKGQSGVPSGLGEVVALAAGYKMSLALRVDGTVVAWGDPTSNATGVPAGLSGVIAISSRVYHCLALRSDGTVAAWGRSDKGQCTVPAGLADAIAVAAGSEHSLALKADGTVVAWGGNTQGQCTIPAGLATVVAIAAGNYHSLALKRDGSVVVWGSIGLGLDAVPAGPAVGIASGTYHSMLRRADGSLACWGYNAFAQCAIPGGLGQVCDLAGGDRSSAVLVRDALPAADLARVRAAFGRRSGEAGWDAGVDLDGNGRIDVTDLGLVTRSLVGP